MRSSRAPNQTLRRRSRRLPQRSPMNTALPIPLTRDLVLIGGGHTHALVLKRWAMKPLPGVRLTLISPTPTTPYTGMLPGHIAGHYPREALDIDLVRLARFAGARLVLSPAEGIDREAGRVHVHGRAPLAYDVLSIDIGITAQMPSLPGFSAFAVPAKPLDQFATAWERQVAAGMVRPGPTHLGVIGGGVAGVELAFAMVHRLRAAGETEVTCRLFEAGPQALPEIGPQARSALLKHLKRFDIELHTEARVASVEEGALTLESGQTHQADFITGAAGAKPHAWLAETGLDLEKGFICVGPSLRSTNDEQVFAVGDCAHLTHAPRPKAGVFAVREAPVLYANLVATLAGGALRPYHPQKDYLKLISVGEKRAVADKFGLRLDGPLLWRLKDKIDQDFMDAFRGLDPMPPPPLPRPVAKGVRELTKAAPPLCGGCGAKVPETILRSVTDTLQVPAREGVVQGLGGDCAVLSLGGVRQVLSTDHLRAFTLDPGLLARVAALHAMGDIWAGGGAPQAALAHITLPPLGPRQQQETLREMMHAAQTAFSEAGAAIVGGHTSLGAELAIGFSVTGLQGPPPARAPAPGDAILLTKALGNGILLAGEMQLAADGAWVANALEAMTAPQHAVAALLQPAALDLTDVTGFGLAGHLLNLLDRHGLGARLELAAVPLLPGVEGLAERGVRASLWEANRAGAARVVVPDHPAVPLLYDPQTAGGFLALVPQERATALLEPLALAGANPALIGEVTEGSAGVVCA